LLALRRIDLVQRQVRLLGLPKYAPYKQLPDDAITLAFCWA
jgi:hypothetical protein